MNLYNYFTLCFVLSCSLQLVNSAGTPSTIEASPYLVQIYTEDFEQLRSYEGAGALITMKMVVSSSFTVLGTNHKVLVVAGANELYTNANVRRVVKEYLELKMDLYITVLEVDLPFEESPTINTIQKCNTNLNTVNEMQVIGWGVKAMCTSSRDYDITKSQTFLRTSTSPIIKRQECLPLFSPSERNEMKETAICGEGAENGALGVVNGEVCAIAAISIDARRTDTFIYADLSHPKSKEFISSVVEGPCCAKQDVDEFLTTIYC